MKIFGQSYFLCDNIWSDNFFSIIKLIFQGKREFYFFYYKTIFTYQVLFKQTQLSIKITIIVVKNIKKTYVFLNCAKKCIRLKLKKKKKFDII